MKFFIQYLLGQRQDRDSYLVGSGVYNQSSSRLINEDLSTSSYTRTDPSYASRMASNNNVITSSNTGGVSADEMFGSSGSSNYYSSSLSGSRNESNSYMSRMSGTNSGGGYRDSLMPYHQNTVSDSNNHWNSTNRSDYTDRSSLSGSNNWNSSGGVSDMWTASSGRSGKLYFY